MREPFLDLINLSEYDNVLIKLHQLDFGSEKKIHSFKVPIAHKLITKLNRNLDHNPYFTMVETECPGIRNLISSNGKIHKINVDIDQIQSSRENPSLNGTTAVVAVPSDFENPSGARASQSDFENPSGARASEQPLKYLSLRCEFPTTLYRILADNKLTIAGNMSITLDQLISNMKQLKKTCVYRLSESEYLVYQFDNHKWIPRKFKAKQIGKMVDRIDPKILAHIFNARAHSKVLCATDYSLDIAKKVNQKFGCVYFSKCDNQLNHFGRSNSIMSSFTRYLSTNILEMHGSHDLHLGCSSGDSNTIFYYDQISKLYVIYLRLNIMPKVRSMQYSISQDGQVWSRCYPINYPLEFNRDGFYTFSIIRDINSHYYLGISANYQEKKYFEYCLNYSTDLIKWKKCGTLWHIDTPLDFHNHQQFRYLIQGGFIENPSSAGASQSDFKVSMKKWKIYWSSIVAKKNKYIQTLHSISINKHRLSYLTNLKNSMSKFTTRTLHVSGSLRISYECELNGSIRIGIKDHPTYRLDCCDLPVGKYIDQLVTWNGIAPTLDRVILIVEFINSKIYDLSGKFDELPTQQYCAIKYRFVSHEVGKLVKGAFGNPIISKIIVQNIMDNGHYPISLHGTEEYNSSMTTIIQPIQYSDGIIRRVQLARDINHSGAVYNVMLTN